MITNSSAEPRPSLFSRAASGAPVSPAHVSRSSEARTLPRGRLNAYTMTAYWNDEREDDWSPSDKSDQSLMLATLAAFVDGRVTLAEAQLAIMEAAARGVLGTGAPRRRSLAWADRALTSVGAAMPAIRSDEGRAARGLIADHFRPLAPAPDAPSHATPTQLAARRARVRAVAEWALEVADGEQPLPAARKVLADA